MSSKSRNLLHMIVFAAIMSVTVYVIFDLEYPRIGIITVDDADRVLIDLRESMK
jgi:dolichol kinase